MVPSATSGPKVLYIDRLYIRSVPNYSTRSPLDFKPADRIPPSDTFPRGSVIVEVLRRDTMASERGIRADIPGSLSVSHLEFDVGQISRAPDGLGSAEHW